MRSFVAKSRSTGTSGFASAPHSGNSTSTSKMRTSRPLRVLQESLRFLTTWGDLGAVNASKRLDEFAVLVGILLLGQRRFQGWQGLFCHRAEYRERLGGVADPLAVLF